MAIPKKGTAPAGRKSMKMEADELTEKIKACVKEALDEQAEAKACLLYTSPSPRDS